MDPCDIESGRGPLGRLAAAVGLGLAAGCAGEPLVPLRELVEHPEFRVLVSDLEHAPGAETVRVQVQARGSAGSGAAVLLSGLRASVWRDVDGDGRRDPAEPQRRRTQMAAAPGRSLTLVLPAPAGRPLWIELDARLEGGWAPWVPPRLLAAESAAPEATP